VVTPERAERWRVRVGPECIGSGACASLAPRHFALGPDHRSHPLAEVVDPDEAVLDAAASCPMEAIRLADADTGTAVEPT
jgi:ferredoxin